MTTTKRGTYVAKGTIGVQQTSGSSDAPDSINAKADISEQRKVTENSDSKTVFGGHE